MTEKRYMVCFKKPGGVTMIVTSSPDSVSWIDECVKDGRAMREAMGSFGYVQITDEQVERALRRLHAAQQRGELTQDELETMSRIVSAHVSKRANRDAMQSILHDAGLWV